MLNALSGLREVLDNQTVPAANEAYKLGQSWDSTAMLTGGAIDYQAQITMLGEISANVRAGKAALEKILSEKGHYQKELAPTVADDANVQRELPHFADVLARNLGFMKQRGERDTNYVRMVLQNDYQGLRSAAQNLKQWATDTTVNRINDKTQGLRQWRR